MNICEIKIELKKQGIKGITGKTKPELLQMLQSGKSEPSKPKPKPKPDPKPKPKPKPKPDPKPDPKPKQQTNEIDKLNPPLLLKLKTTEPEPEQNKAPPLANKSLIELYKMNLNLEKTIKDNVNTSEAERSKKILKKVKIAFRYNREKFINKINKLRRVSLLKMKNELIKQHNDNAGDTDAIKIIEGQLAEVEKLI